MPNIEDEDLYKLGCQRGFREAKAIIIDRQQALEEEIKRLKELLAKKK